MSRSDYSETYLVERLASKQEVVLKVLLYTKGMKHLELKKYLEYT